jgi:hypothetical protein
VPDWAWRDDARFEKARKNKPADIPQILGREGPIAPAPNADQHLHLAWPDRHDENPARLQLIDQRWRDEWPTGSDEDRVEWSMLGPAAGPVAVQDVDIVVAQLSQPPSR